MQVTIRQADVDHKAMNLSGKQTCNGLLLGLQVKLEPFVLPPENGDLAIPEVCKFSAMPCSTH